MTISEAEFVSCVARFREQAIAKRFKLSAARDLYTKAFWDCAYSQAMKRCRNDKLEKQSLHPERISSTALEYRVDVAELQEALFHSLPSLDPLRIEVALHLEGGGSVIAISGPPGVTRDAAIIFISSVILGWQGTTKLMRFLHLESLEGRDNVTWNAAWHTPITLGPRNVAEDTRAAIAAVLRSDPDATGICGVNSVQIADEMGALIIGSRWTLLAADDAALVARAMNAAGHTRSTRNVLVDLPGSSVTCHLL